MIKLSILICAVPSRVNSTFYNLIQELMQQATDEVEILWFGDNKKRSIGQKRNDLITLAKGEYVVFIDDDDRITYDYIESLLGGIKSGADAVVFKAKYTPNGREVFYDIAYKHDFNTNSAYFRIPNHLMCVKRTIALSVKYKDMNFGEDAEYAKRLRRAINTQHKIDNILYFYDYNSRTSEAKP